MGISSIGFPEMFSETYTNVITDRVATQSNIELLLESCKMSLLGDPYFGTSLRKFIFEPNNIVLRDLIIDEIYVSLVTFIPQIHVTRKDIVLTQQGTSIHASINCINKLDNEPNMYQIKILEQ